MINVSQLREASFKHRVLGGLRVSLETAGGRKGSHNPGMATISVT